MEGLAPKASWGDREPKVLFLYGASDRSGEPEVTRIQRGLGLSEKPSVLDWARMPGLDPKSNLRNWLTTDRYQDVEDLDEADPEELHAAIDSAVRDVESKEGIGAFPGQKFFGFAAKQVLAGAWNRAPVGWKRAGLRHVFLGLMENSSATIADSIFYIRRGPDLLSFVRDPFLAWSAQNKGSTRVVLGLSLGGIIAVDMLAGFVKDDESEATKPAELLITVGSQAPILFQFDALVNLRRSGPPVTPFRPWFNIWNRDDFLSYPTRGAIDDGEDCLVADDEAAFADNHSRYFGERGSPREEVFESIRERIVRLER